MAVVQIKIMKTKALTFTVFLYEVLSVPVCLAIKNPLVAGGGGVVA